MTEDFQVKAAEPWLIGIYLKLPSPWNWACHVHPLLLSETIKGPLYRRSLLVAPEDCGRWHTCYDKSGHISFCPFESQIWGIVPVTKTAPALDTIIKALSSVSLLEGSHIAWHCPIEGVWRNYWPNPEPTPFETHISDFAAWLDEPIEAKRRRMFECAAKLFTKLSEKPKDQP